MEEFPLGGLDFSDLLANMAYMAYTANRRFP